MALMLVVLIACWLSCLLVVLGMCVAAARGDALISEGASPAAPPETKAGPRGHR